jgi:hypothetical protein
VKTEAQIRELLDLYKKANRSQKLADEAPEVILLTLMNGEACLSWVLGEPLTCPKDGSVYTPNPLDSDAEHLRGYFANLKEK